METAQLAEFLYFKGLPFKTAVQAARLWAQTDSGRMQ